MKRVKDTREPRFTHCQREGCGKVRRRPKGKWCIDAWLLDRYCSTECAKADHGVNFRETPEQFDRERDFDLALAEASA